MIAKITTILIITIFTITACNNQKADKKELKPTLINKYMSQNQGGYIVLIEGQSVENPIEMFVLHENGKASWKLVNVYSGGKTEILSDKTGAWSATSTSISIDINGNTGLINETFTNSDGKYKNGERYLQKTN